MTTLVLFFLFTISSSFLVPSCAQDRAPHGLAYENPIPISPSAYDFFHPTKQQPIKNSCASLADCSPLPEAAQVASTEAKESKFPTTQKSGGHLGANGILGIFFGLAFAVLVAMGAYYVLNKRRSNLSRENSV